MGDSAGSGGATGLCAQEQWCLSIRVGSRAKGRVVVWGGSGGHSVQLCCKRSLTGPLAGNKKGRTCLYMWLYRSVCVCVSTMCVCNLFRCFINKKICPETLSDVINPSCSVHFILAMKCFHFHSLLLLILLQLLIPTFPRHQHSPQTKKAAVYSQKNELVLNLFSLSSTYV